MIIKRLWLQNFGIYAGPHDIVLSPVSATAPIVLIGGLNGGGKTTLLDAVQLALFGKLSRCSSRGNLAYEEFLRRSISRKAEPGAEAVVQLELRQTFDGTSHDFIVRRSWTATAKGATETLVVHRDGVEQKELAESWLEHVDQFVPLGLAELFFFDGEKIARLADTDNAAQMLQTAINTLLGIDLVDRLEKDLQIYERDLMRGRALSGVSEEAQKKEAELEHNKRELERLAQEAGSRRNELDLARKRLESEEQTFRSHGGDLYVQRKQFEAELNATQANLKRIEADLREIAAGASPLLLIAGAMERVRKQAAKEEEAERQKVMLSELHRRDLAILSRLEKEDLGNFGRLALETLFAEDRRKRERTANVERYLNLPSTAYTKIQATTHAALAEIQQRAGKLLEEHRKSSDAALQLEGRLAKVPDAAAIADQAERLRDAERMVHKKEAEVSALSERIEVLHRVNAEHERAVVAALERALSARADHDELARKLKYAARVRDTMRDFRTRVLERKIKQIAGLILESFQQLVRKENFVTALKIDPTTYNMELFGPDGGTIRTERLSAGERQLLAVSLLWGLAKASGRPLPNIIDTPLGRLDSHHRINLVERYFPFASHQVIILSTDEEIGARYLPKLRPRIGRSYRLGYSEETASATITKGYFDN